MCDKEIGAQFENLYPLCGVFQGNIVDSHNGLKCIREDVDIIYIWHGLYTSYSQF